MTLPIAISIVVPILVALLGGTFTLINKYLDLRNSVEQRHSDARLDAYDRLLAAGDAAWNYVARDYITQLDEHEKLPRDEFEEVKKKSHTLMHHGLDQLKSHSRDYDAIEPILVEFYLTIFEPSQMATDVGPEDYERVRTRLVECRRRESGLRKRLRAACGKSWKERRAALQEARKSLSGVTQVLHFEDHSVVQGDGDAIIYLLERMMTRNEGMRNSVKTTEERLKHWRDKGMWS